MRVARIPGSFSHFFTFAPQNPPSILDLPLSFEHAFFVARRLCAVRLTCRCVEG